MANNVSKLLDKYSQVSVDLDNRYENFKTLPDQKVNKDTLIYSKIGGILTNIKKKQEESLYHNKLDIYKNRLLGKINPSKYSIQAYINKQISDLTSNITNMNEVISYCDDHRKYIASLEEKNYKQKIDLVMISKETFSNLKTFEKEKEDMRKEIQEKKIPLEKKIEYEMKEKQITRAQKIAANNLKIYNNKYKVIDNNLSSLEAYSNLLIGIENTTNALVENTVHVLNEIKVIKDVEIPMEQLLRSTRAVTSKINKLMNYSNTVVEGIAETSSLFSEGLSEISQSKEKYHETVQKLNHFKSRSEELNQQFIEDVMDETEELLITMGEEKSHEKTQEDENVIDASFKEI